MSYLYVCLNSHKTEQTKLKLEFNDANISAITVQELKAKLAITYSDDLPKRYDLTFFGRRLKSDQNHLSNYGIKTGAYLFVLPDHNEPESDECKNKKIDKVEFQRTIVAIRTALVNSNFRSILNRLYDKEFRENIVACTPGLRDNIVAFGEFNCIIFDFYHPELIYLNSPSNYPAILQDPELMMMCTDVENLPVVSENPKYSVFAEAAGQLATAFHEELIASSIQSNGGASTSGSTAFGRENTYSMNYDSDSDDLGGVDAAPPEGQQVRETQPIIQNNRITVSQLQQAIQAANQAVTQSRSLEQQSSSSSRQRADEPFSQQQNNDHSGQSLLEPIESSSSSQPDAQSLLQNPNEQSGENLKKKLETMRNFGCLDEAVSITALIATDGNVNEAINLYFVMSNQS